ncbi:MAG: hypothetical protein Tp1123DCM1511741_14 [Prokaryotic dsDNA virus sp.]|nr:MAG: hypothetical protein Tp1123DCM1511741_14 [Prokaryotic dsDNA virus sp.]|tara:strand:+ start:915 stop:1187 length:273 start_codon:yes stop_codon:yes gene_type:complete
MKHKGYKELNLEEKKYPLIMVDWLDHTADARWVDEISECKAEVCRSIGWLIKEDDENIKVANAISRESGLGGIQVILKVCILEMWQVNIK